MNVPCSKVLEAVELIRHRQLSDEQIATELKIPLEELRSLKDDFVTSILVSDNAQDDDFIEDEDDDYVTLSTCLDNALEQNHVESYFTGYLTFNDLYRTMWVVVKAFLFTSPDDLKYGEAFFKQVYREDDQN